MKAAGIDVIGFGAGEPDFPTPAEVVDAAVKACNDPRNYKYTPTPACPSCARRLRPRCCVTPTTR